ncbi:GntR family transcriptional regulator [Actinospica durhamensis]|uniref:GntR family transcriptional regulator n=1 Tax=Actinospica durhamensis TaxID=1508375 RepID=A0A941F0P3_9ACTN|nr:GntR family transcriptional regulator [Actinospica durhamensis]MBR7838309.1 GntR family transcriptional regulator [Actinospica durhamensis]
MSADVAATAFSELANDRHLLGRTSTAELVAGILRGRIAEGLLPPGTRLAEEAIGSALAVSRNTLREAFRLLTHERLLVHELNRGVFVRTLTAEDVAEIYRVRRVIECAAVRRPGADPAEPLARAREAVAEGEQAAADGRWGDVGTANIRFHQALGSLAGSSRVDGFMAAILAELRLVFHVMANPRAFHEPYLGRNRELVTLLESGDYAAAEQSLAGYLDAAEAELVHAYAEVLKGEERG